MAHDLLRPKIPNLRLIRLKGFILFDTSTCAIQQLVAFYSSGKTMASIFGGLHPKSFNPDQKMPMF